MPAKEITRKDDKANLQAVLREKLGSDALDSTYIHGILAAYIRKSMKAGPDFNLSNRIWARIIFVTDVMLQTVSLSGEGRFDVPGIDATDEDITDFYEFMMIRPANVIDFFRHGFLAFDALPNPNGGQDVSASKSESTSDLTLQTPMETNAIPA